MLGETLCEESSRFTRIRRASLSEDFAAGGGGRSGSRSGSSWRCSLAEESSWFNHRGSLNERVTDTSENRNKLRATLEKVSKDRAKARRRKSADKYVAERRSSRCVRGLSA